MYIYIIYFIFYITENVYTLYIHTICSRDIKNNINDIYIYIYMNIRRMICDVIITPPTYVPPLLRLRSFMCLFTFVYVYVYVKCTFVYVYVQVTIVSNERFRSGSLTRSFTCSFTCTSFAAPPRVHVHIM